jgi:acetyltransferase-like isoleucine patch superfamily enzyme
MKELLFLTLANNLPRIKILNRFKPKLFRLAGMDIKGQCTIWGPISVLPIGAAKNISIGKGSFLNSGIRFGAPKDKVIIGENVLVGPNAMFETVNHGLIYEPDQGRGAWTKPIIIEDGYG